MKAGYEFGRFFVLVEPEENGSEVRRQGYLFHSWSYDKRTRQISLTKNRRSKS